MATAVLDRLTPSANLHQLIGQRDHRIEQLEAEVAELRKNVEAAQQWRALNSFRDDIADHIRDQAVGEEGCLKNEIVDESLGGEDFIPCHLIINSDYVADLVSTRYIVRRRQP